MYQKPKQSRSILTEQKFLDALDALLREKSFKQLTVDEIAERANLHRGAFLKRFGSKKRALLVLFDRYCKDASAYMLELNQILHQYSNAEEVCTEMSKQLEQLQSKHFASNRAMHEIFSEDLVVDIRTKKIFKELVELTKKIQCVFLSDAKVSDNGALSASQLLVTINYNYVLKAMTAFPRDTQSRHHLIGKLVTEALKT